MPPGNVNPYAAAKNKTAPVFANRISPGTLGCATNPKFCARVSLPAMAQRIKDEKIDWARCMAPTATHM